MLHIHLSSSSEEDLKETITILQQGKGSADENATDQQQPSSDRRVHMVIAEEKIHEEQAGSKKYRKDVPNYFVAIPITSEQILDKIEDVQELIFIKEPNLFKALIPVQTIHLTIIVAHLRTDDDVKRGVVKSPFQGKLSIPEISIGNKMLQSGRCQREDAACRGTEKGKIATGPLEDAEGPIQMLREESPVSQATMTSEIEEFPSEKAYLEGYHSQWAVSALEHSKAKVQTLLQGKLFSMTFHGIGQFNNQVIYVKMSEDEQQMLSKIAVPEGFRKIREDLYTEYEDSAFGTEILNRIDLCAMHKKKQDSGYYHCEYSINVGPTCTEDNGDKKEPREEVHCVALSDDGTCDHTRANRGSKDLQLKVIKM
ncbi:hypothetical protein JD844_016409 [Phrynosoma platyrhinos]|uniref:A-kinase anchor protein 7-like phosphoesterase domain-containing protein n=1 Tax=Phrynosoma platyrhinos TaxID=52577 RepID=A0ABQ7SKD3_PHRPL|nr:hypothetical protein JD844_016409 [Phrynosoma platyrhinos]